MYRLSDSRPERYTELMGQVDRLKFHSGKFGQSRLVTDEVKNIVFELLRKKVFVKSVKVMFVTLPRKCSTPQNLKLKFHVHTSSKKKKLK
jgi:hypothetical protein